jgi:DNA (cytosine-5)-methyltransferase 1
MNTSETDVDCKVDNAAGRHSVHRIVGHVWRHLDLFSGIGGFALAARWNAMQTVGFCEREPYAQAVLRKHWPDVPICDDIHKMKGNEYGPIDLITGGFPCQPYSFAGERRGNDDDRALWPEMRRVIREARPTWVLGENVPGIITLALDGVLADLENEGYACETLCIPACGVDARHRRERVWIVGHAKGARIQRHGASGEQITRPNVVSEISVRSSGSLANTESWENNGRECRDVAEAGGCGASFNPASGPDCKGVFDSAGEGLPDWAGGTVGQPSPITEFDRSSGREIERDFRGVAHGVSRRVDRLKALGNAIVPQVAAEIMRCIMRVDSLPNNKVSGGEPQKEL